MATKPMAAKRRLLFVQTQAENAGAQEVSRLLGQGLEARGHEVHHLFFYKASDGCDGLTNALFVSDARPHAVTGMPLFLVRLVRQIRRLRPDVLLSFQHYGNVFAAPAAKLAGVPHVVANHVSARATVNDAVRRLDRLLGSIGVYDRITVNSRDLLGDYAGYPERYRKRISLVPHGFADKSVTVAPSQARRRFALPPGVPLIGSVSRLHPLKRIHHAVQLLAGDPALHLALAGQGPDRERLLGLARNLGVAGRFHLVGELSGEGVGVFLAGLDAFVFPTEAETFGLAAVEAAQVGLPVVANDLPVLREVLAVGGEPCALFVDTADTAAFGAAVRRVLSDRELAASLSARGRRLTECYSLDAMVDAYAALVERGGPERAVADRRAG